jgi:dihydroflavonol-4-reductase
MGAPRLNAVASSTLITGASGLVGSHVARALAERGDDLRLLLRERSRLDNLSDLDYETAAGDILDRRSLRRALKGVDRVFHVAGMTSLRASVETLNRVNVEGTRTVLEECLRAGVERVVYTSSAAAIGPAPRGSTADETQAFAVGGYGVPYVNAKREAEVEALRLAARGLPVVIVNPGHVFGRGDIYRSSTDIVRRFLRRQIPAYVDGALNIVDVDDVARGHLLADEHGEVGERYILGNRNFTFDRLFADLGRLSGVEPPALKLPAPAAMAFALAAQAAPGTAPITTTEVRVASMWWAFRSTKAKRELGYKPAPHEDTIEATIDWYRGREGERLARPGARQPVPFRLAGFAVRQVGGITGRFAP